MTTVPPPASTGDEVLSVQGISVSIGGREILHDVTFSVSPGEFTGLIGSNGAGKTTIFRVVLGLQPAMGGSVQVAGRPRSLHNRLVGYVPQKVLLDPDMPMRARDVVALGLDGHRLGLPLRSRQRRHLVDEMLDSVGATAFAERRVGSLSGGEQQRVLIAHAMISRPRLLLLDEPLANLDLRSEQEVVGLLSRIARDHGVGVLLSAHEINPLLPVMDRIVYVAGGRVASGSTEEVVRPDVLTALYGHHVDVIHVHGRILVVAGPEGDGAPRLAAGEQIGAHPDGWGVPR